jgi:hypothetical protein
MAHSMFQVRGSMLRTATGLHIKLDGEVEDFVELPGGIIVLRFAPSPSLDGRNVIAMDVWGWTLWRAEPAASPYFGGQYAELERDGAYVRLIAADGHSTIVEPTTGRVVRRYARSEITPPQG